MNIVYGGSFNPPTLAHFEIVDELKRKFNPENIIIIPVGNNYDEKELLPSYDRINMLNLMFQGDAVVSDIETNTADYKGTYSTLEKLSKNYDNIHFVMGADNIVNITKWRNYKSLVMEYKFIIISRGNIDIKEFLAEELHEYIKNFIILDFDSEISSTKIRENLSKNKEMLHEKVYNYIIENNLQNKW